MTATFQHHMTDADTLMWNIEADPLLRSTITAVAVLDATPDWDRVVRRVTDASAVIPRLRQRVVPPGRGRRLPEWVDDPDFDSHYHLRRVVAPAPANLQTVLDLARTFAMGGFDRARPLWEFTLVEGLEGGQAALIQKVHHSLTDGVGGIKLAMELFDTERNGRRRPRAIAADGDADPEAEPSGLGYRMLAFAAQAPLVAALTGVRFVSSPRASVAQLVDELSSVAKLLAPASAKLSPLMQGRSLSWSFTAFDVSLGALHDAAAAAGGTVNDAFLAAVTGGLHRYHERHGVSVDALRMTLPISLRTESDPLGSNRFTPARFVVPVGIADPAERMHALGLLVRGWRGEPAIAMTDALASGLNRLPKPVVTGIFGGMLKNVDFVATNVPGMPVRMYLGGAEIVREYAFAPPSGAAMNIAFLSHVGVGCVGVLVDVAAVPDPDVFTGCLLRRVRRSTRAGPRPGRDPSGVITEANSMQTRLTALDANFLEIESPTTPMHVGALSRFEGAPLRDSAGRFRLDDVRRLVAERIALVPRFRQRLLTVPFRAGRPVWVDDPEFDVAYHVNLMTLPSPGSPEQLRRLAEHLHMQLLDRSRPLWELWFVDGLADGTIAEIEKIHHSLVDGVASVDVAMVLCDTSPITREVAAEPWQPLAAPSRSTLWADSVVEQMAEPTRIMRALWNVVSHPQASADRIGRLAGAASTLLRRQNLAPRSSLNQAVGRTRILESVHLSLADVRETRRALGGTVNDVVLAAVTGGVRRLLEARGEGVGERPYQALVPVSIRSNDEHDDLGNRVAAIMAPLPVGEPDPLERLRAVRAAMGELKAHGQALATGALLAATEFLPAALAGPVGRLTHRQPFINLVITNVPGPQQPLYLAGARLLESIPIVPLGGNLDVSVGVFSYDGQLVIGLFADGAACPDVSIFAEGIEKSFAELHQLADERPEAEERT